MTAADAITYVREARWGAVEMPEQEAVLAEFASRIQPRSSTPPCLLVANS
jgi:hypothetical protein